MCLCVCLSDGFRRRWFAEKALALYNDQQQNWHKRALVSIGTHPFVPFISSKQSVLPIVSCVSPLNNSARRTGMEEEDRRSGRLLYRMGLHSLVATPAVPGR